MASRGNNNRGRGRGSPFRGQSWAGQNSPRGRGSSTPRGGRGRGRPGYNNLSLIDIDIQRYADENSGNSGYSSPSYGSFGRGRGGWRGRGRGRGAAPTVQNYKVFAPNAKHGTLPPRREDDQNANNSGRPRIPSRGLGSSRYTGNTNVPLSNLLNIDRPYLRPIIFVPAQLTPVLFRREEEIIEVPEVIEEPEDHVPTADRVARVFSHSKPPDPSFFYSPEDDVFGSDSEPVVTIDFNSMGKFMDVVSQQKDERTDAMEPQPEVQNELVPGAIGTSIFSAIQDALSVNKKSSTDLKDDNFTVDTTLRTSTSLTKNNSGQEDAEVTSTGQVEVAGASSPQPDTIRSTVSSAPPLFVVDPNPSTAADSGDITFTAISNSSQPLGTEGPGSPGDDEIIVYEAPNPRSGRVSPFVASSSSTVEKPSGSSNTAGSVNSSFILPATAPPSFDEFSFSFGAIAKAAESNRQCIQNVTPRARRITKKQRQLIRKPGKSKGRGGFGAYGAMLQEIHLHDEESDLTSERRQGSDIDWGDADSDVDKVSSSLGAMSIDSNIDQDAYKTFVTGMSTDGMAHTRIDDLEDAEKLRIEDEEDEEEGSEHSEDDSEFDEAVEVEEALLLAEEKDSEGLDDSDEDVSSDEDETPQRSFQARLARVRSRDAKGKAREAAQETLGADLLTVGLQNRLQNLRTTDSDDDDIDGDEAVEDSDDDDYEAYGKQLTWADRDEEFIAGIHDILDENQHLLSSRDRKQKRAVFQAVRNGSFSTSPAPKKRDYVAQLPPELREQWEKDRARKAENKAKRALARLAAAADPFAPHKGGKKGLKAMVRASRLEPPTPNTDSDGPSSRIFDPDSLVRQIRAFVTNLGGPTSMALPPMDKAARAKVHEIALAFKLKSVSKGKGAARYTTLQKTSRTLSVGGVDERRVTRVVRGMGDWSGSGRGGGGGGGAPRHREGDEIGKEAPKIGEGNIGFKMLSTMGWTEGDSIGVSGGIDAPITAIIKNSKLGLGASRSQASSKADRKSRY